MAAKSASKPHHKQHIDSQANALSYSSIQRSIASSTKTRSTSVRVLAICLNFGRNPFNAVKIRRLDSGDMLAPYVEAGVAAKSQRQVPPTRAQCPRTNKTSSAKGCGTSLWARRC